MRICLLEDDLPQAELLKSWLQEAGYEIDHGATARDFLQLMKQQSYDLAILDWEVPDISGVEVLGHLRGPLDWDGLILFTTQHDAESDVAKVLRAGADDYLVKPLRKQELLARLISLGRRKNIMREGSILKLGPIELHKHEERVTLNGETVKLTAKDFQLTKYMFEHEGELVSREQLLKTIWGISETVNTRTVDVHMSRIRRKLDINPDMGYRIKTIYQYGYRLEKVREPAVC